MTGVNTEREIKRKEESLHFEYRKSAVKGRESLQFLDSYLVSHSALIISTTVDQPAPLAHQRESVRKGPDLCVLWSFLG